MIKIVKNPFSESILPLDKQLTRTDEPLPKSYITYCFIGKKGSGKSTLLLNLIKNKESPYYQSFDNIFLVSPTANKDDKFKFLMDEIEGEGKYYNECNDQVIQDIIDKVEKFNEEYIEEQIKESDSEEEDPVFGTIKKSAHKTKSKKKKIVRQPSNLLILDDCLHELPKSTQKSKINEIFTTSRHKRLSIFVVSQKYNKLNPIIRSNCDLITIFPTDNKLEFNSIENDWAIDKNKLETAYKIATEEPNSFLHISLFGNRPIFFKKYDKIVFE